MNNLSLCNGAGDNGGHCCYLKGKVCQFLVHQNDMPRCQLMLEYNDWDKVHNDSRYLRHIKPILEEIGLSDCGIWGTGKDGKPKNCCYK